MDNLAAAINSRRAGELARIEIAVKYDKSDGGREKAYMALATDGKTDERLGVLDSGRIAADDEATRSLFVIGEYLDASAFSRNIGRGGG